MGINFYDTPVKVVCCDYYRTLVRLEQPFSIIKDWISSYLRIHHPSIDTEKFYGRFLRFRAGAAGMKFKQGIDILAESLEKACRFFHIPDFHSEFIPQIEELFISPPAYPDAHRFLSKVGSCFRIGLLTNADNYLLKRSVERQGFFIDFIITSEDAKACKPSRGIFDYALNYLGIREKDMLMVGDSQVDDVNGAGMLGIKTVWINRTGERLREGIIAPSLEVVSLADALEHLMPMTG